MAYEATELFQAMTAAEAAWRADEMNVALLNVSDAAFASYMGAVSAARKEWMALPEGDAKFSAETNADDTEGCDADELKWLNIALATYQAYGW